jgi:hypothetical protein
MREVTVFGVKGNWNEQTYKSTLAGKRRIYVSGAEYHLTDEQLENIKRNSNTEKPTSKPSTQEAMKNSRCPRCGGWCYGDCQTK